MCFYSVNYSLYLVQQFHTDYAFQCAFLVTSHFRNAHMPPILPKIRHRRADVRDAVSGSRRRPPGGAVIGRCARRHCPPPLQIPGVNLTTVARSPRRHCPALQPKYAQNFSADEFPAIELQHLPYMNFMTDEDRWRLEEY